LVQNCRAQNVDEIDTLTSFFRFKSRFEPNKDIANDVSMMILLGPKGLNAEEAIFEIRIFLGGNSQNYLRQVHKIFVTFRCFYKAMIRRK